MAASLSGFTVFLLLAGPVAFAMANDASTATTSSSDDGPRTFYYFAYGSNLLGRRLLLNNPTAKRHGIGKLQDYRLDFSTPSSPRWGGAPATVVPDEGSFVWGAIWALDAADRDNLDRQEGVSSGWYIAFNATVITPGGDNVVCRSYRMGVTPPKLAEGEVLPAERQPSRVYKQVILTGARESGLPADYITLLETIHDNGSIGIDPPISLESLNADT